MVMFHRSGLVVVPAFALLVAPACSGDDGATETSTSTGPGTTDMTAAATTGTSDPNPTTGSSIPDSSSTGDPSTSSPGTATTTTGATTGTTGDDTTAGTDPGTTDMDTGTGTSTTGAFDPAEIPEIPDDGMPSSAHYTPIPLGMSEAKQGYWEYLPPGYGGGEKYPLLVFLHGIGENGNGDGDLFKVNKTGLSQIIKQDNWPADRPFVVVAPQHPGDGCPGSAEVHDFIDYAANKYDINPGRIYLTGLSCGAIGSWNYLAEHLDTQIVAMVPIAGNGKPAFTKAGCELGRVPLWAFHGDKDGDVNVSGTINPITSLQGCDPKPDAEMVIYPGVGHNSWQMTYDLSAGHDIYAWLLEHYKP